MGDGFWAITEQPFQEKYYHRGRRSHQACRGGRHKVHRQHFPRCHESPLRRLHGDRHEAQHGRGRCREEDHGGVFSQGFRRGLHSNLLRWRRWQQRQWQQPQRQQHHEFDRGMLRRADPVCRGRLISLFHFFVLCLVRDSAVSLDDINNFLGIPLLAYWWYLRHHSYRRRPLVQPSACTLIHLQSAGRSPPSGRKREGHRRC